MGARQHEPGRRGGTDRCSTTQISRNFAKIQAAQRLTFAEVGLKTRAERPLGPWLQHLVHLAPLPLKCPVKLFKLLLILAVHLFHCVECVQGSLLERVVAGPAERPSKTDGPRGFRLVKIGVHLERWRQREHAHAAAATQKEHRSQNTP